MPAIPMIIQIILGALFAPAILRGFGINLAPADVQNGVSGVGAAQAVPASTAGATAEPAVKPTFAQTANDAVKNPVSLFGIGVVLFTGVFMVAQLRAASHEAGSAAVDVYNEGKKATGALQNADGTTKNISRRAKN